MAEMQYVEVEETECSFPLFPFLDEGFDKEREKMSKSCKNVIVSFQDIDPIMNFNSYRDGPIINATAEIKKHNPHIYFDEEDNLRVDKKKCRISPFYCPICGTKIDYKTGFHFEEFFNFDVDKNPYFNKKKIDNKIIINYHSCKKCLQAIEDNFKKFGKPLKNPYLLKLYIRYAEALGFEYSDELNKNSRCLYPIDRLFFKFYNEYIYLNLFNLSDYVVNKFNSFAAKLGHSEEDIEDLNIKVLSSVSKNILDENDPRFEIYRKFELLIKEDAKKSFKDENENLIKAQFSTLKLDVDVYDYLERENDISDLIIKCTKGCEGCTGELKFNTKDELFSVVQLRNTFDTCKAKEFEVTIQEPVEEEKSEEEFKEKIEEKFVPVPDEFQSAAEILCDGCSKPETDCAECDANWGKLSDEIASAEDFCAPTINDDIVISFDNNPSTETKDEISEEDLIINTMDKITVMNTENEIDLIKETSENIIEERQLDENTESVKSLIIQYCYPSTDVLFRVRNLLAETNNCDADTIPNKIVLNEYADMTAEEIFRECQQSGKEILNKYPGLTYSKLKDFIFDLRIHREKLQKAKEKKEQDKRLSKADAEVLTKDYSFIGEEVEDPNMEYLQKTKEKEAKENKKKEHLGSYKTIFNTPAEKGGKTIPFIMDSAINEIYSKSAFKTVFDEVYKCPGYKAGNNVVTINEYSCFTPIVDFPDVGIRFVCIDTTDINNEAFKMNPVNIANSVPFPNYEYRKSYSLNIIYSNECQTRPNEVARHIFKLVNYRFIPKERHVLLSSKEYPLAYTNEVSALGDFEKHHSIFSDRGRVKNGQVTLIAFVENDTNDNRHLYNREKNARNLMDVFNFNRYNSLTDLLYNYTMYYVAAAHYTAKKIWNRHKDPTTGKEYAEPYILYSITQYTENKYCIVADGLPAVVAAILKEHDKQYAGQNMQCAIVYEYDMTALVSPSVRQLLLDTTGIFNVDATSMGQPENEKVTNYMIIENRFKSGPTEFRDDFARADWRWFESAPETFRKFLSGKIRKDENIDDRHNLLSALGYVPYPSPKPFNYNITTFAMKQLEESSLYQTLFEIQLSQLGKMEQGDAYKRMVSELYANKIMAQQNIDNVEEVGYVSDILKHAYRIFVAAKDQYKK